MVASSTSKGEADWTTVGGGVGVWGRGQGDFEQPDSPVDPYIGVYGQSQTVDPASPYPVDAGYLATGVLGIGDRYGGVFQTTPQDGDETYANVQLTPHKVPSADVTSDPAPAGGFLPTLPREGKAGDIVAADIQVGKRGSDPRGIQLWVCIKPAPTGKGGATWARIHLDVMIITP